MVPFAFFNPVRVVFGAGSVSTVGAETARLGKNVLLVTYRDTAQIQGTVERVEASLQQGGCRVEAFREVVPNPRLAEVQKAVVLCRERGIEALVAVGGGSAIDTAKIIALAWKHDGDAWDLFSRYRESGRLPDRALPIVTVTTIPGTSSEMNSGAVLTNEALREKAFLYSDQIFPKVSILDPELTCSLPSSLTACGAADALSHIMEPYFSSIDDHSPVQERLQEALAAAIMEQTLAVLDDPRNVEKRANLQWGITLAHNGWVKTGIKYAAPMHLIGHVLSARYDLSHGAAMSIVMPAWMKTVCTRRAGKFGQFAARVFGASSAASSEDGLAREAVARFEDHLRNSGAPTRLSELPGLIWEDGELSSIRNDVARLSFDADGLLPGNPRIGAEEVLHLLRTAR